jgi:hypothetical protein
LALLRCALLPSLVERSLERETGKEEPAVGEAVCWLLRLALLVLRLALLLARLPSLVERSARETGRKE